jgi:hypothetical protein
VKAKASVEGSGTGAAETAIVPSDVVNETGPPPLSDNDVPAGTSETATGPAGAPRSTE